MDYKNGQGYKHTLVGSSGRVPTKAFSPRGIKHLHRGGRNKKKYNESNIAGLSQKEMSINMQG